MVGLDVPSDDPIPLKVIQDCAPDSNPACTFLRVFFLFFVLHKDITILCVDQQSAITGLCNTNTCHLQGLMERNLNLSR